jgi:hypothetical protein
MYGDDKNLVAWGIKNDNITLISVENGKESVLYDESIYSVDQVYFKVTVERGSSLSFLWSKNGKNWIKANDLHVDAEFLVRWDRVARPGLIYIGEHSVPAEFDFFELINDSF